MTLRLHELRKSHIQGTAQIPVLNQLSLEVASGEVIAIVGESGSGKSTLLTLLAGLDVADSGEMLWDQQSTQQWNEPQWARFRMQNLGFVFQNYYLIPYLTALENVALPLRLLGVPSPDEQARELLSNLGLGARMSHLPTQLSGGEAQRVAIARAIIHQPQLVLADEPTGSLDTKTGHDVLDLLFDLFQSRKQTAILVTHSAEVARRCHRVLTLKQGRLWPA